MEFDTKFVIVIDDELPTWKKLNVVSYLSGGVIGRNSEMLGREYKDKKGNTYLPLCIQPTIILKCSRDRLSTILNRSLSREIEASIFIEDMFITGDDASNRDTVIKYNTEQLPLVGIGLRADKKIIDKVTKGAKMHD
ncbi:DUF2000 family protein [Psychromonas sp.]|uniref:DUF2000 family protein n=1 Tax=Psychromonas sp. TaxID=1884585 RepID=UPI003A970F2D